MMPTVIRKALLGAIAGGLVLGCLWPLTSGGQPTNLGDIMVGPERLKLLEKKATERDTYARKVTELQTELAMAQASISNTEERLNLLNPRINQGRLSGLERKSWDYDRVVEINEQQTEKILVLEETIQQLRLESETALANLADTEARYTELTNSIAGYEAELTALKEELNQYRLGNYEYYEVRKEGETLDSIAADPLVYKDPAKRVWIEQANQFWISDFSNLPTNTVLIIPRFPPSGTYNW